MLSAQCMAELLFPLQVPATVTEITTDNSSGLFGAGGAVISCYPVPCRCSIAGRACMCML